MKKHSDKAPSATQVSYVLNATRLRLSRFQLIVQSTGSTGKSKEQRFAFDDGPVHIGSLLEENQIVLNDETVSRKHCLVEREGDYYVLRDLESTNGTFVNQVRVKEIYLSPGLEFQVGKAKVIFEHLNDTMTVTPSNRSRFGRLIGGDVKMREIFTIIEKISKTDTTVIVEGETGTGKDVLAQTIHETSRRKSKPFVVVDCSAIPEHLIESELFGHEKGSFTGAIMARKGLFEQADGGTIFLDELGELSLELQPKLLRVLESRSVRRVGGHQSTKIDVRVIAATNRKLEEEVKNGQFREDLFYRLSVVRIFLPPLRERVSDLKLLIEHFLANASFNKDLSGVYKLTSVSHEALSLMMNHTWPGNVRELLNVIERACTFADSSVITIQDLPQSLQSLRARAVGIKPAEHIDLSLKGAQLLRDVSAPPSVAPIPKEEDTLNEKPLKSHFFVEEDTGELERSFESFKVAKEKWVGLFEKDYILTALKRTRYNISHAARESGIDRKYFRKLMNKYDIEIP